MACWRVARIGLHLLHGICLTLLLRLKYGVLWHQQPQGRYTICNWMQRLTKIIGLRIHLSRDPTASADMATSSKLLVANHVSWLEVIAIGCLGPTRFLAKEEVSRWPIIGLLTTLSGTLFIRRESSQALRISQARITQALMEKQNVLIFPEGTTTDGNQVERFRPALFETARIAQCSIQPISICYRTATGVDRIAPYIGDDTFVSHLWRIVKRDKTHIYVHFCKPVDHHRPRQKLAKKCYERICTSLLEQPSATIPARPFARKIGQFGESNTQPLPLLGKKLIPYD